MNDYMNNNTGGDMIQVTVNAGPNYAVGTEWFEDEDDAVDQWYLRLRYPNDRNKVIPADAGESANVHYWQTPLWGEGMKSSDFALVGEEFVYTVDDIIYAREGLS